MATNAQPTETFFDESNADDGDDKRKSRSRRPSFRKTLSFITDSRRSSFEASSDALTPSSPRARRSFTFPKRSSTQTFQEPQTPSQYYQDPEARMKLKMVLASTRNFDQALEHGFPASTPAEHPPSRSGLSSHTKLEQSPMIKEHRGFPHDASFFDDGNDSDNSDDNNETSTSVTPDNFKPRPRGREEGDDWDSPADEEDDDRSVPEFDSPVTPCDRIGNLSNDPRILGHTRLHEDSEQAWTGAREMTLRMTLTKPELRASEEQLYGRPANSPQPAHSPQPALMPLQSRPINDPLALEALPAMRDHSALRGHARKASTNAQGSKVRGLFRKMRTGSRG